MKIEYDQQADAMYVYLASRREKVWKSREVESGIILDLNRRRQVVGIEILEMSRRLKFVEPFKFSVKHAGDLVPAS